MANNIVRYTQPAGVTPLGDAIEQLFRDAFTWPRLGATAPNGTNGRSYGLGLGSNLYETNDSYLMQIALPGASVEGLQITAVKNVLSLQGTVELPMPQGAQAIWVGQSGGEFREQVTLPGEVDGENASAEYRDGILTLTLPKAAAARVKTIKVGSGTQGQTGAIEGQKK